MTIRHEVAERAGVEIPAGMTIYTYDLQGSTLEELLDSAQDDVWPNNQCDPEWVLLRNWAIQTESMMLDEGENLEWERRMRELTSQALPYLEWIEARGEALKERTRARKLAQANLRYKYGYRGRRRWGLLRRAVRDLYREWGGASSDE
ncbi:hypothetical protein [Microbacterium aerolatum]|uniref:hypothetical protein n=1 Tax=Microbacterium aerolatum TaxID=153731 RepID=UPI00385012C9